MQSSSPHCSSRSGVYLDSMSFDLPILTSDRDFAHERCQDAAIYFDPLDANSVAKAMARVMEAKELRRRLVENGRRVLAQTPTWVILLTALSRRWSA